MQNLIKIFQRVQEIGPVSPPQSLDLRQMVFDNPLGYILSIKRARFGKGKKRTYINRQISITENHRCDVIFIMSELRSFGNVLNFDAVSILKHVV